MVEHSLSTLGQIQDQATDIVLWGGLVLVAAVLVGLVMLWLRRKFREEDAGPASAFSMSSLEQMRSRGEITDEEFKALRRRVLGLHEESEAEAGASSEPPADDDEREAVE